MNDWPVELVYQPIKRASMLETMAVVSYLFGIDPGSAGFHIFIQVTIQTGAIRACWNFSE